MTFISKQALVRKQQRRLSNDSSADKTHLPRPAYLQALVNEFQDIPNPASPQRLQILANLANFAYDPVNYHCFRQLNILHLFADSLADPNSPSEAREFAATGLCNCCLDPLNRAIFLEHDIFSDILRYCLHLDPDPTSQQQQCPSPSHSTLTPPSPVTEETVISALSTLYFLSKYDDTRSVVTTNVIRDWVLAHTTDPTIRVKNLANLFVRECFAPLPPPTTTTT